MATVMAILRSYTTSSDSIAVVRSVPSVLCCGMQRCVAVKAFDTALEALQRAQELGLQFFRGDAYFAVMKGAVLNKQLDIAIKYDDVSVVHDRFCLPVYVNVQLPLSLSGWQVFWTCVPDIKVGASE